MYIYIYTYIYISIPVYAFLLTSLPLLRGSLQREVLQRALELVLVVRGGAFSYVSVYVFVDVYVYVDVHVHV